MLAFCRSRLRSREEAEDAAQTTFLLAHRALRRGVVPLAEATWLVTIAQNVCLNRSRSTRRVREHELSREPQELERLAGAADPEPVDVGALRTAVEALPEPQRRALLLREWQGLSYAEIERELGLGKAAVETLIFRGRRAVAAALRGEGGARRRALDAGSLLSALKGLLGGGGAAAKLAGAAAVTVAATGVAVGVAERGPEPDRAPAPAHAPALAPAAPATAAAFAPAEPAPAAVPASRPSRAAAELAGAAATPSRPAPTGPAAVTPVPTAEMPPAPTAPAAAPPAAAPPAAVPASPPAPATVPAQPVTAAPTPVVTPPAAEPVAAAVETATVGAAAAIGAAVEQVAPTLPPETVPALPAPPLATLP